MNIIRHNVNMTELYISLLSSYEILFLNTLLFLTLFYISNPSIPYLSLSWSLPYMSRYSYQYKCLQNMWTVKVCEDLVLEWFIFLYSIVFIEVDNEPDCTYILPIEQTHIQSTFESFCAISQALRTTFWKLI